MMMKFDDDDGVKDDKKNMRINTLSYATHTSQLHIINAKYGW